MKPSKKAIAVIIAAIIAVCAIGGVTYYKYQQKAAAEQAQVEAEEAAAKAAEEEAAEKALKEKEAEEAKAAEEAAAKAEKDAETKAYIEAVAADEAEKLAAEEAAENEAAQNAEAANTETASTDNTASTASDTSTTATETASTTTASQPSSGTVTICIDAGHGGEGGNNHGCEFTYNGVTVMEKTINLAIAQKVKSYLEAHGGINVVMTRTGDYSVGLSERVNIGKNAGADYFISIHNNSSSRGNAADHGCMVLATQSNYNGCYAMSNAIASSVLGQLQGIGICISTDTNTPLDGGIYHRVSGSGATYPDGSAKDYYAIISGCTNAGIPSVIIEHAYLSNQSDYMNYLSTDAGIDSLARADANGIIAAIGL